MEQNLKFVDVTYKKEASGWVDGVYYPREAQQKEGQSFLEKMETPEGEIWKLHGRAWQEIEETGFGVYYFEETTRFTTNLTGANYVVTCLLVNPGTESYHLHIRSNGVIKAASVEVAPGEEKEVSFVACLTNDELTLTFAVGFLEEVHSEVLEGDIYLKDLSIQEEAKKEKRDIPRIFLVSDSTVQSYGAHHYPQTGWGQVFFRFFEGAEEYKEYRAEHCDYSLGRTYELPGIVIENRSIGGRSARSFYDEGKLDQVLEVLCPGDFMFVQFAHNDATAIRPNRYIAVEEFQSFLQRYVDACAKRGAQLVFVTPVTMLVEEKDGSNKLCFAEYREEMMKLAKKVQVPLLDLSWNSNQYVNQIGREAGKQLYLWLEEGEYPDGAYANGVSDKCHLQEYGAKVYANIVARLIEEYEEDDRLDVLKKLIRPIPVEEIPKPVKKKAVTESKKEEGVTGFVVQEISIDGQKASFLLNWNPVEGACAYLIYGKKKEELTFEVVRRLTRQEKESLAVLPFTAEAGTLMEYYVVGVFENGKESAASKLVEVDLR